MAFLSRILRANLQAAIRGSSLRVVNMTTSGKTARKPTSHTNVLKSEGKGLDKLRDEWRTMYTETLPKAAREKQPSQKHWYVWRQSPTLPEIRFGQYSKLTIPENQASLFRSLLCSNYTGCCSGRYTLDGQNQKPSLYEHE